VLQPFVAHAAARRDTTRTSPPERRRPVPEGRDPTSHSSAGAEGTKQRRSSQVLHRRDPIVAVVSLGAQ
jgi:hypothetical protein